MDVVRLGKSSKAQPVEGDSAEQDAEADVGVPGGDCHNFVVPKRNHGRRQEKGRELVAPLTQGTAKGPSREARQAAPEGRLGLWT